MEMQGIIPPRGRAPAPSQARRFIQRWIYVFTAGLLVVTAVAGFGWSSIHKIQEINAGRVAPYEPIAHIHAVLMAAWLLVLLVQAYLMVKGPRRLHKPLGIASLAMIPPMIISSYMLLASEAKSMLEEAGRLAETVGLSGAELIKLQALADARYEAMLNLVLFQARFTVVFPFLIAWAFFVRRTDSETHRRLVLLATIFPVSAATGRVARGLFHMPDLTPLSWDIYPPLLVLPMFLLDYTRLKRIPKAYVIWFAANLPFFIGSQLLYGTEWWENLAAKILGVG